MGKKQRRRGVRLTARDTRVFEDLLHRRADSLGTIHERHWPAAARDTARRRLGTLVTQGYLERSSVEDVPGALLHPGDEDSAWVPVYTLTPRALVALRRRSLAGSILRGRSFNAEVSEAAILHQLAVNRVGDILGATLTADHLLDLAGSDRRHRPDATYSSGLDTSGRGTVMLEVDLGHYSRQRILGKTRTFLADPDAKAVLFACPTDTRAAWVAQTLRAAHGDRIMDRVQVLSFEQILEGRLLREELSPEGPAADPRVGAYERLPGVR